jgi:hypothetical protein
MFKPLSYSIAGLFIGLLLGFMVGLGESNYYKKSQREYATPILSLVFGAIFAVSGAGIGYKIGSDIRKEEILGIDKIKTDFQKHGRFWLAKSEWIDTRNNIRHKMITQKSSSGELSSTFNDREIFRHNINSGSLQNVKKFHTLALKTIFQRQKSSI